MQIAGKQTWSKTGDSSANTAQTVTKAAVKAQRNILSSYVVWVRAAAAGADITVEFKDGDGNVLWQDGIGSGAAQGTRVGHAFQDGVEFPVASKIDCVVAAGGTGAITEVSFSGWEE